MEKIERAIKNGADRRSFLKKGMAAAGAATVGAGLHHHAVGQHARSSRKSMRSMKMRALLAMVLVMGMASPAHADKVICDGNPLCLVGLVPVIAVMAVAHALTPAPPEKSAEQAIRTGSLSQLQFVLQTHPQLLTDTDKAHGLLLAAAEAANVAATTLLLDAGVPANAGNSRALWYATSVEEMELLLARGANADEVDLSSMVYRLHSPVIVALMGTLLIHRTVLNPNNPDALRLLNAVVRENQFEHKLPLVHLLLERGVNPNGPSDMSTLVQLAFACAESDSACAQIHLPVAQALINKGADVNIGCKWTPLQAANHVKNASLVALLKSAGAGGPDTAQAQCHTDTSAKSPQRAVDP